MNSGVGPQSSDGGADVDIELLPTDDVLDVRLSPPPPTAPTAYDASARTDHQAAAATGALAGATGGVAAGATVGLTGIIAGIMIALLGLGCLAGGIVLCFTMLGFILGVLLIFLGPVLIVLGIGVAVGSPLLGLGIFGASTAVGGLLGSSTHRAHRSSGGDNAPRTLYPRPSPGPLHQRADPTGRAPARRRTPPRRPTVIILTIAAIGFVLLVVLLPAWLAPKPHAAHEASAYGPRVPATAQARAPALKQLSAGMSLDQVRQFVGEPDAQVLPKLFVDEPSRLQQQLDPYGTAFDTQRQMMDQYATHWYYYQPDGEYVLRFDYQANMLYGLTDEKLSPWQSPNPAR